MGKPTIPLLSHRFTEYLTANKYVDPTLQKAFLPGINGCIEHNVVMDEIIKSARSNNKTLHITWYDLEDAFGSVPHSLIMHSLERTHFPPQIQNYIREQYKQTTSVVQTGSFKSEEFSFKRGVFQGDPLSPIIFLLAFNPVLKSLQEELGSGYNLRGENFITLPYADDFCLITTNSRTHQRLMNVIDSHIESMGMRIKPSKCRTFSLKSGKPSKVDFNIKEDRIPNLFEEEQKFLGKVIFPLGKSSDTFEHIKGIFFEKLERIDKSPIRSEYKLWVYEKYFLSAHRFLLTVHTLTSTDLKKLDIFTDQYLKKWAGVPKCTTNALIHMRAGLHIKSISQLYEEAHMVSHARTRMKGDSRVNHAVDCTVERESAYIRKKSITVSSEQTFQSAMYLNAVGGDRPAFGDGWERQERDFDNDVSEQVNVSVNLKYSEEHMDKVEMLTKQGDFLYLAACMEFIHLQHEKGYNEILSQCCRKYSSNWQQPYAVGQEHQ